MTFKPPSRELLRKIFNDNHEMIKTFESLYSNDTGLQDSITRIQEELDRIETAVGLETDGIYIQPIGTNYINGSTSFANADALLDVAIGLQRTKIINATNNYQALSENQLIIVDCISGNVNITLPNPVTFILNGYSKHIGITKKDNTINIVNILPYGSETIVGENTQNLKYEGEVLNFISDGTNWHLGA